MTDVLIDRELLERILNWREGDAGDSGRDELRAMLAAAPSAPKADDPVKVQLLEALEDLVRVNEQHNSAIQRVTGTPAGWKDDYLNLARAAIAAARKGEGE